MVNPDLEIDHWNAGQGDCSVIKLPNGKLLIIDVGPRGCPLVEWLLEGRRNSVGIEGIVLTHNDADHAGALPSLIKACKSRIGAIYMLVDRDSTDPKFAKIFRAAYEGEKEGLYKVSRAETGKVLWSDPLTGVSVEIIHPGFSQNVLAKNPNETSAVVVLCVKGDVLAIWPGDLELIATVRVLDGIRPYSMIGPHHGAPSDYPTKAVRKFLRKNSQDEKLRGRMLEMRSAASQLGASRCYISVGTENQYSHPRPGYLRLLANASTKVVCSQLTYCCDRKSVLEKIPVFEGAGALGLRAPKSGVSCRGAMRFRLNDGKLIPDQFDQRHFDKITRLRRPQCRCS